MVNKKIISNNKFLRDTCAILLKIEKDDYTLSLARKTSLTPSHIFHTLEYMLSHKLITKRKEGRTQFVNLTEKGERFKILTHQIFEILKWIKKDL